MHRVNVHFTDVKLNALSALKGLFCALNVLELVLFNIIQQTFLLFRFQFLLFKPFFVTNVRLGRDFLNRSQLSFKNKMI